MANETKTRGQQLIRADRAVSGIVKFLDMRVENVGKALIGQVSFADVMVSELAKQSIPEDKARKMATAMPAGIVRAAIHGWTQNLLDSSNKLEGDARVAFVKAGCETIKGGGWVSAPVDENAAKENLNKAVDKMAQSMGMSREDVIKMLAAEK